MIAVLIPTIEKDQKIAQKIAELHKSRSGIECNVYVLVDKEKIGWVAMINKAVKKIDADYYVYSCADYFPGRNWLMFAMAKMLQGNIKLVGFNDGKWNGAIATVGLIEKEWMISNYSGDLLYSGYKKHWADTELTLKAKKEKVYGYNPEAVLVEIDFEKDTMKTDEIIEQDKKLFKERGYKW